MVKRVCGASVVLGNCLPIRVAEDRRSVGAESILEKARVVVKRIRRIGIASLVLLAACAAPSPPLPGADRPSIVLVLADDLRADVLGYAGHPFVETPHIDRLAREGVAFDGAFVLTAVCAPSRATLLSGLPTHRSGVSTNRVGLDHARVRLVPQMLREAGYATGFVGKYHLGSEDGRRRAGFDHWVGYEGAQGDYLDATLVVGDERVPTTGHSADVLTDHAVAWIREQRDRPFFLLVSLKNPHVPLTPPERHRTWYADETVPVPASFGDPYDTLPSYVRDRVEERERRLLIRDGARSAEAFADYARDYARMVPSIDEAVGRIYEALSNTGALDRTLLLFTSDNGRIFGEHGLMRKGLPYEPSIRVPMVARLPGWVEPGSRIAAPVLNLDLPPTILDLAGVDVPEAMSGRTLTELVDGGGAGWREDWLYLGSYHVGSRPDYLAVRGPRYKYVRYVSPGVEEQLFDLVNDPDERHNLAADPAHAELLARSRARMMELLETEALPTTWMNGKSFSDTSRRPS